MKLSNFIDLKARVPIALAMSIVVTGLILFAHVHIIQLILILCLIALSVIGLWEFSQLLQTKEISIPWSLLSVAACCWLFSFYITLFYQQIFYLPGIILAIISLVILVYNFNKLEGSILRISSSFFAFLYTVVPLGIMIKILYPFSSQDGRIWLAYLICVTKATDIGAYFIGKIFGKKRLAAELSPAKTVGGAIGGLVFGLGTSLAFYLLTYITPKYLFNFNIWQAIMIGTLIGVIGQVGDLAESLMKRDAQIKDSNALPGVGGVLDLLDSLYLTTPVLYLFMKII